jgi:lysine-specific permease
MGILAKRLEARHINMMAIGGSIGTGLFLASGYAISVAGPGGALLAYIAMAVIVYFLMTSLAEMSAFKPSAGSFCDYSTMYVGKSFGVAMGYNYWLSWASTIAVEISAASLVMSYWFPEVNHLVFSAIFFLLILLSNILAVRIYGEIEYWLSFIKVSAIGAFIILGIFSIYHQPSFGLERWQIADAPFHSGWYGFIYVFLFVGFAFQGTELVGLASEETKHPEVTIPNSIKMVFWRLSLFYILSIGVISLLVSFDDPKLVNQDSVITSPYTLVFASYIGKYAADVVNFIILVAILSAANACLYSSTRILWYLGNSKQAPEILTKVDKKGVPYIALICSAAFGSLVFLSSFVGNGVFFDYIVHISSLAGFLVWFGIAFSHYKFRSKFLPQIGGEKILKYKARFFPFAPLTALFVIIIVIIGQYFGISQEKRTFASLLVAYSSLIFFLVIYLSHKIYSKLVKK